MRFESYIVHQKRDRKYPVSFFHLLIFLFQSHTNLSQNGTADFFLAIKIISAFSPNLYFDLKQPCSIFWNRAVLNF